MFLHPSVSARIWIEKTGQAIITRHEIVISWMMGKVLLAHPLFVLVVPLLSSLERPSVFQSSCFLE